MFYWVFDYAEIKVDWKGLDWKGKEWTGLERNGLKRIDSKGIGLKEFYCIGFD